MKISPQSFNSHTIQLPSHTCEASLDIQALRTRMNAEGEEFEMKYVHGMRSLTIRKLIEGFATQVPRDADAAQQSGLVITPDAFDSSDLSSSLIEQDFASNHIGGHLGFSPSLKQVVIGKKAIAGGISVRRASELGRELVVSILEKLFADERINVQRILMDA